jgi:hypothetical protein
MIFRDEHDKHAFKLIVGVPVLGMALFIIALMMFQVVFRWMT